MNRNIIFASLVLAIILNTAIIGCHRKGDNESTSHPDSAKSPAAVMVDSIKPTDTIANNPYEHSVVEIKTFTNNPPMGGFGYDVYVDQVLKVHQPHIPAISGNKGFSSEQNARKTGEFVGYKFKHNIFPPSVSPKELDSLGVLR